MRQTKIHDGQPEIIVTRNSSVFFQSKKIAHRILASIPAIAPLKGHSNSSRAHHRSCARVLQILTEFPGIDLLIRSESSGLHLRVISDACTPCACSCPEFVSRLLQTLARPRVINTSAASTPNPHYASPTINSIPTFQIG